MDKAEIAQWFASGHKRIQMHPATDTWMKGDRFGTILSIGRTYVKVKMDRSGRTLSVLPGNIAEIIA